MGAAPSRCISLRIPDGTPGRLGGGGQSPVLPALATPEGTRAVLREFGIRPSRRWGQHFLVSARALRQTIAVASLSPADSVLEVGAGIGTLTRALAEQAGSVTAVEVDRRLLQALHATVDAIPNVRIVPGDILQLSPTTLFTGPPDAPRKVVSNLPYNIASAVLMRLLEAPLRLAVLVVTVQREVAERITASPGSRAFGILSVAIQYRAAARIVARVPAGAFLPRPEVESALLELIPRGHPPIEVPDEASFFRIVAAGFGQRRKTLSNAVASGLGLPREIVERAVASAGITPRARAETLDLDAFGRLTRALFPSLARPASPGRNRA